MSLSLNLPESLPVDVLAPDALEFGRGPTVSVPVRALRLGRSPRTGGLNDEHCRMLAASGEALPPVIVHSGTMQVIDGSHRVRAAVLQGRQEVAAVMFDGTADEAFVLAVRLNLVHGRGLLLSRADRTVAAARLVTSHPYWSNRMIASLTGLSAGTIGRVRGQLTAQTGPVGTRVGKDGRSRPVDGSSGRMKAYELLLGNPSASIREIAKRAGVSPSTAHDVRKRLQAGEEPVPRHRQVPPAQEPAAQERAVALPVRPEPEREEPADPEAIIAALTKDPSIRYNNIGRRLIRWLDGCRRGVAECPGIVERVPSHNIDSVAALAREYAHAWGEFAAALEERNREAC
ncbi:winged helix-turn-helix transcriptional regulator [Streptomyces sp. NPDC012389]|uniref:winged helix-turn-helix transcriptional regulator n=1 Tax=unclassified Streptomyces TaxID=2593676 RepID=UPI00081F67F3|nr:winged helix-turn-helix transcriptional regulator [Streptomyces sp. ScaeMP-e83]MYR95876.1 ParB N-terminal domain-containing protein [Streptomyces sp. SID4937]SCD98937.1 Winged helix-turn-helix DNA-binding [Streptomyces sp. ScaeMP-e83]